MNNYCIFRDLTRFYESCLLVLNDQETRSTLLAAVVLVQN